MTGDSSSKLRQLHEAAERVSANLVELELDSARQLLEASSLSGTSAAKWSAASAALTELWRRHGLLEDLLKRADKVRRSEELRALLDGPSVQLATADVPLAKRTLLAASQTTECCTTAELLAGMSAAFDEVKLVVSAIGDAWDTLIPKLDVARQVLQASTRLADELGEAGRPDLQSAHDEFERLNAAITTDPLSATPADADTLTLTLRALLDDLEGSAALRRGFDARVLEAHKLLERVSTAVRAAQAAHDEVLSKISVPTVPPVADIPHGLAAELTGIVDLAAQGSWREARRALEAWTAGTTSLIGDAQRALEANRAPIEARNQFRALLDAYQVKAKRLGHLEDADLAEIYERARAALYTAPTDLADAAQLVRRYQQRLAGSPEVTP
jgi:hypothetical protein